MDAIQIDCSNAGDSNGQKYPVFIWQLLKYSTDKVIAEEYRFFLITG